MLNHFSLDSRRYLDYFILSTLLTMLNGVLAIVSIYDVVACALSYVSLFSGSVTVIVLALDNLIFAGLAKLNVKPRNY